MPISEACLMIVQLAVHRAGVPNCKDRVLTLEIDERWKATVNGCRETRDSIPPFSIGLEFNGFPAGIIDPGGGIMAAGDAANEATLIRALRKAMPEDMLAEFEALKRGPEPEPSRQIELFPSRPQGSP